MALSNLAHLSLYGTPSLINSLILRIDFVAGNTFFNKMSSSYSINMDLLKMSTLVVESISLGVSGIRPISLYPPCFLRNLSGIFATDIIIGHPETFPLPDSTVESLYKINANTTSVGELFSLRRFSYKQMTKKYLKC